MEEGEEVGAGVCVADGQQQQQPREMGNPPPLLRMLRRRMRMDMTATHPPTHPCGFFLFFVPCHRSVPFEM